VRFVKLGQLHTRICKVVNRASLIYSKPGSHKNMEVSKKLV
jgi:hypothetical protein